ncbi:MAG: glycoside hydrolase family 88 protein, partial [Bryobacteraceae bacterium]
VIDVPASYAELTATCMISTAMFRGVRRRWLERRSYQPAIDRAWQAITERVAPNGDVSAVCPGTGKQKTLEDYLNRAPISGRDDRGGSMALLVATEMAGRPEA